MRKSVENLLVSSHDVVSSSISSLSASLPFAAMTLPTNPAHSALDPRSPSPSGSPQASPRPSPRQPHRREASRTDVSAVGAQTPPAAPAPAPCPAPGVATAPAPCPAFAQGAPERSDHQEDAASRSSDSSQLAGDSGGGGGGGDSGSRSSCPTPAGGAGAASPASGASPGEVTGSGSGNAVSRERERKESGAGRAPGVDRKKKTSWYSALYPTYKSRSEDFKRLFKEVPPDERLIVDYSCALQKDILVHGRLYVSQHYLCFYANIFRWETQVTIQWKDVTSITKEKTALVIPNAVLICTESEKHFLTSFTARDKTFLMLFRVWQNALLDRQMSMQEMWQWVHTCYGDELGLTSDDEDYINPTADEDKPSLLSGRFSVDSFSEQECFSVAETHMEGLDPEDGGPESPPGAGDHNSSSPGTPAPPVTNGVTNGESIDSAQPPPTVRAPSTDMFPTDMSDTTESDAEKGGGKAEAPQCTSLHKGRHLLHVTVPLHIDQLFTLLFTSSKFMVDFHTYRRTTDIVLAPWQQNSETQLKQRTLTMTVALSASVGPRSTQVCEQQVMLPCSKPGHLYAIDVESNNGGIPYADSFYVFVHYCLARAGERECRLDVYGQIKYRKSVWGLVKSFIERNTWAGLEDFYLELDKALRVECERLLLPAKKKLQRRRRGAPAPPQGLLPEPASTGHRLAHRPTTRHHGLAARGASEAGRARGGGGAGPGGGAGAGAAAALGGAAGGAVDPFSWVLLAVLLVLAGLNVVLYYKLWLLEAAASAAAGGAASLGVGVGVGSDLEAAQRLLLLQRAGAAAAAAAAAAGGDAGAGDAGTPRSPDDWLRLLQHQEALHNAELRRWQRVLHAAVRLLRQTEDSLADLQLSIAPLATQQVLAALKAAAAVAAAEGAVEAPEDSTTTTPAAPPGHPPPSPLPTAPAAGAEL